MEAILKWQFFCLGVVFIVLFVACLLPLLIIRSCTNKTYIPQGDSVCQLLSGLINCTAAGICIAMCFLGLIPNVRMKLNSVLQSLGYANPFPCAEFVVIIGFFFVLTLDQFCKKIIENGCCRGKKRGVKNRGVTVMEMERVFSGDGSGDTKTLLNSDDEEINEYEAKRMPRMAVNNKQTKNDQSVSVNCHQTHANQLLQSPNASGLSVFFLFWGLSSHAVFEGIAMGLQTEMHILLNLLIAILLHESICALTLGINIARCKPTFCKSLSYSFFFSATVPFGISVGVSLGHWPGVTGNVVAAGLQALAAGAFIHVIFMDLIPSEFSQQSKNGLLKVLFIFIGFMLLTTINLALDTSFDTGSSAH